MAYFISSIVDNDPKGESGGTCYLINAEFGCTKESFTYTIMDEVNNTVSYKKYLDLLTKYKRFLVTQERELVELAKSQKDHANKKRLNGSLTKDQSDVVKHILGHNQILVSDYEKCKGEKQLNALVGRCLGQFKMIGKALPDPLLIKRYIIEHI